MLKKKLVSNTYIFLFFLFFYSSIVYADIDVKQGDFINENFFSDIYIGMNKKEVLEKFGIPILIPDCDVDCFCYYYYTYPLDKIGFIKYNYVLMFFDKSKLVSFFLRI